MHFSKTYTQLLLGLPPELRENTIEYRQLKKVINSVVNELSALGLEPDILHELIETSDTSSLAETDKEEASRPLPEAEAEAEAETQQTQPSCNANSTEDHVNGESSNDGLKPSPSHPRVVYELNNSTSGKIEPLLRIWISVPENQIQFPAALHAHIDPIGEEDILEAERAADWEERGGISGHTTLLSAFQRRHFGGEGGGIGRVEEVDGVVKSMRDLSVNEGDPHPTESSANGLNPQPLMREVVVPLVHDTEFYNLLSTKLESISEHLRGMYVDFTETLKDLARTIADTSHPASMAAKFQPLSGITSHAGAVRVKTGDLKNDLYFWRQIFQLYVEAEVFEGIGEASRGERTVEESERRLQLFADQVTKQGLGDLTKFKLRQSREALEQFLGLNLFILNVKKLSFANSEATRKILKKHSKRTALTHPGLCPAPSDSHNLSQPLLVLVPNSTPFSFPRILVQAIGETLLPIIPSVEDYACLICTSIAFKPIRLSCGHLFCVRCLVKMQKRKSDNCPMCRSPSVLVANRTNVDWALLNFMQDWFPLESKVKLQANEKEAAEEEMRELGLDPNSKCIVM